MQAVRRRDVNCVDVGVIEQILVRIEDFAIAQLVLGDILLRSVLLAALVALVNFSAQTQRYGVFLAMPPMVQQAWPLCSALYVLCLWRIVDMVEWL